MRKLTFLIACVLPLSIATAAPIAKSGCQPNQRCVPGPDPWRK